MKVRQFKFFMASILAVGGVAGAQVDFSVTSISEPLSASDVQTAAGAASTLNVDGIALGSGDSLFLAHRDGSAAITILEIDAVTKAVTGTPKTAASIATDLGGSYTSSLTLVGEFVLDAYAGTSGVIYFADNSTTVTDEYSVLSYDVATGTAAEVIRSGDISGWNSHGILSSGNLVGTLGEEHEVLSGMEPETGVLAVSSPAFTGVYDVDDYKAAVVPALGPSDEAPPETIGVNPVNDDVYVFCHDTFHIFRISDIESAPSLTWLDIPGWTGVVDLHGLAVDEDGNLYGFDEAAEAIVVYNGTTNYSVSMSDIETALGGVQPFGVSLWRGLKVRKINATQSEAWLASGTSDYGVVRIVFGDAPTAVQDWSVYQ